MIDDVKIGFNSSTVNPEFGRCRQVLEEEQRMKSAQILHLGLARVWHCYIRQLLLVVLHCLTPLVAYKAVAAEPEIRISISGKPEIVADHSAMRCGQTLNGRRYIDVPDMPPTAFRRNDGRVLMLAGSRMNWFLEGSTLDKVERTDCSSLIERKPIDDPAAFQDNEWLMALYSKDKSLVIGFVHNEYHGEEHNGTGCSVTNISERECWYAATTLVISRDGGATFARPAPPRNIVAAVPYVFNEKIRRAGNGMPKIVGHPSEPFIYVMTTLVDRGQDVRTSQCLYRTTVSALSDWRSWNGVDFSRASEKPYNRQAGEDASYCTPVLQGNVLSLKYISKQNIFVALDASNTSVNYRTSRDLVHWSTPRSLVSIRPRARDPSIKSQNTKAPEQQTDRQNWLDQLPSWYFSLLDPTSSGSNFDTLDAQPYLYYVRYQEQNGKAINAKRDIMRVRINIQ